MKFIESVFDVRTGISAVSLQHLGKKFVGWAKVHPDDKEIASEFAGCGYAEARARIKAMKYERNKAKEEAEICRKFIKACSCYKNWDPESPTAKAAYRQLNRRIKKVNDLTEIINDEMFILSSKIWKRDITIKALERNKQKRLNDNSEN